ncbi:unnamed protein product [Didymodactylos carnosus]|uniref:Uncharacterized protein n=1 Tax=Didymodactylos carnosus TaxID=1234261 RepID=A0A814E1D0_9BILA|nr:unnamed protein product [Didymodactylos carnosus]CAF0993631.1 unnamed protein product [Didymodactylos carnosus]CAF3734713.1 unnamed protein product [Didymodactylos carnosus]CAF3763485.1 unnamed protein product [Didymodactylos carnosus]
MSNSYHLENRVAIVTGADSGIGQGIAVLFAKSGADVVVTYRSDEKGAQETRKQIEEAGRKALVLHCDVGDEKQVQELFDKTLEKFKRLDILVNNAGTMGNGKPFYEQTFEDWEKVIRTNLHGPFLCSKLAAQQFIKQIKAEGKQETEQRGTHPSGNIINISSVHEDSPGFPMYETAYGVSKGGLRNLTRAMSLELAEYGIRVNDVAPGLILTPMNQEAKDDPKKRKEKEALIPLRRSGVPKDIATMVTWLCSDDASYCTGQTFFVDGGWMLSRPEV